MYGHSLQNLIIELDWQLMIYMQCLLTLLLLNNEFKHNFGYINYINLFEFIMLLSHISDLILHISHIFIFYYSVMV